MPLRRRKIIMRVLVLLLLGAIVNVAVAWGCACWVNGWEHGQGIEAQIEVGGRPDQHWWLRRRDAFGSTRITAGVRDGQATGESIARGMLFPGWSDLERSMQQVLAVTSTMPRRAGAPHPPSPWGLIDDGRGWPRRALQCYWNVGPPWRTNPLEGGIELSPFGGANNKGGLDYRRALPLRPMWPGFAINTVFYAAILWGVFAAPFALRRRRRIKRGLCVKCAYPLGESDVCTECGAVVKPPPKAVSA